MCWSPFLAKRTRTRFTSCCGRASPGSNVVTYIAQGVAPVSKRSGVDATSNDVQVVLYNDDATPMTFLARVLPEFFAMDKQEAAETMLEIYRDGKAVCGLYSREDGEALVQQVTEWALESGHPLQCVAVVPK